MEQAGKGNGKKVPKIRWECLLCGRNKFVRPYVPHKCFKGQVIKHFNHVARIRGLKSVWRIREVTD